MAIEESVAFALTESEFVVAETVIELADPIPAPASAEVADVPPASSVVTPSTPGAAVPEPVADDVRQAFAAEPEIALEPVPTPAPQEEAVVAAPALEAEENLFTRADAALAEDMATGGADEPTTDRAPAEREGVVDDEVEEPNEDQPEPVNPLDAATRRTGEPARLWIDATGRHSLVGVLVDLRQDGTCRLDTGAGLVDIPVAALRRRDRDYAEQAARRLAAPGQPAVSETVAR